MGRAKINMEFIQDHKNRKSTLVKRKASLVKKISELVILCGIKVCMIIYGGITDQDTSQRVQIWPNDPKEVDELINLYKNQPLTCRSKRATTFSNFFENQRKNPEIKVEKYPTWDSRFDYLSEKELQNLARVLEKRIEDAKGKAEFLKSTTTRNSSLLSHQEIRDYTELMNNNYNNLMNQATSLWPSINYNFFQANIQSGVGTGMDIQPLTIDDYQFEDADYSMKIEAENWLANNGIGSSSTIMAYPIIYNA
ncbi:putative anthraniloyl-CoA:methanol acyltransferase-like [Capsicum annuum]|nr:putative anthraniloyl-CoA:methanol acyltransferase-like [Capsicum annuum]KAF3673581.1 putative anthraniloyl-CoA:methanol acyltransferase-like [Capsicum annuum]